MGGLLASHPGETLHDFEQPRYCSGLWSYGWAFLCPCISTVSFSRQRQQLGDAVVNCCCNAIGLRSVRIASPNSFLHVVENERKEQYNEIDGEESRSGPSHVGLISSSVVRLRKAKGDVVEPRMSCRPSSETLHTKEN